MYSRFGYTSGSFVSFTATCFRANDCHNFCSLAGTGRNFKRCEVRQYSAAFENAYF